jgi:transcriptional regulator GlxA family with amidase domain
MNAAVVLFDGVEELDFAGPYEVFAAVANLFTVAPTLEVRGHHGLRVRADHTFESAPQPDLLIVPGGPITHRDPAATAQVEVYVKRAEPTVRMLLSVCTGAFILARAGLLDGRSCTTHYRRRHLLLAQHPQIDLHYARIVADGKLVTTAGVAAGIDGSLFTVSRLFGMERARKLAKQIEYPWDPSKITYASRDRHAMAHEVWA